MLDDNGKIRASAAADDLTVFWQSIHPDGECSRTRSIGRTAAATRSESIHATFDTKRTGFWPEDGNQKQTAAANAADLSIMLRFFITRIYDIISK